jgi:homocysteine S-methyltransferase
MGTEIYRRGVFINRCYDELNVGNAALVGEIHQDYAAAGADILTTNTYGAQRIRLSQHGLESRLREINREGVRLAREAAGPDRWVAGSMGPLPLPLQPSGPIDPGAAFEAYREQAEVLADAGVDLFVLETFRQLGMLDVAVRAVRAVTADKPIIASFAFKPRQNYYVGTSPEELVRAASEWPIDVLGTNCVLGPHEMLSVVERMAAASRLPLAAQPNAGSPEQVDGRTLYLASPEYMAEYARRLVQGGVQLVGGCCGTTPAMIAEMRSFLASVVPGGRRSLAVVPPRAEVELREPTPQPQRSRWGRRLGEEFCISVELDAPRGLDASHAIEGARLLASHGVQAINIADGPRATARMSALSLGLLVKEAVDIDVIVHYCCRDRNILGMQMDLLGAHMLGIRNLLCVTGDPPKMGNYPDATAVFDLDSVELIRGVRNLNSGVDMGGDPIGGTTEFVIGCGCNPGFEPLDKEVEKYRRKLDAGVEYVFSQPVYDPRLLERFLDRIAGLRQIPFFVGILPLASAKNAEFLHNEVPGMQIPEPVRARMHAAQGREAQREVGLDIAAETLQHARALGTVSGAYLFPPFGRYQAVLDVLNRAGVEPGEPLHTAGG